MHTSQLTHLSLKLESNEDVNRHNPEAPVCWPVSRHAGTPIEQSCQNGIVMRGSDQLAGPKQRARGGQLYIGLINVRSEAQLHAKRIDFLTKSCVHHCLPRSLGLDR